MKFYPYKKNRGGGEFYTSPRGRGRQSFAVVLNWELEVLAIMKRGAKCFHRLKWERRRKMLNPVLRGEEEKIVWTRNFHIL